MSMKAASDKYVYACGALIGALVGDSVGSKLEFWGKKPTSFDVDQAMKMPGGGYWRVAPGQITDDGELTLCLAKALIDHGGFNLDGIASNYVDWLGSKPFDIGITIADAFDVSDASAPGLGKRIKKSVHRHNMASKANGSLMRCVPLGIWGHRLSENKLAKLAFQDSRLSHPNIVCCESVACYVIAVAALIRSKGDVEYALDRVEHWSRTHLKSEVKTWLEMVRENEPYPFYPQAGYVKIAFINAFRCLRNKIGYTRTIQCTIAEGGDTDTNACIAGGLVGAAVGVDKIDPAWVDKLLKCDTFAGRERPMFYHPANAYELVEKMMQ